MNKQDKAEAFVMINRELGKIDELVSWLSEKQGVNSITPTFGAYDVVIKLEAGSIDELRDMIQDVRRHSAIRSTITLTVLHGRVDV